MQLAQDVLEELLLFCCILSNITAFEKGKDALGITSGAVDTPCALIDHQFEDGINRVLVLELVKLVLQIGAVDQGLPTA